MGENDRVSEWQQSRLRDGKCCRFRGGAGMSDRKSGVNGSFIVCKNNVE